MEKEIRDIEECTFQPNAKQSDFSISGVSSSFDDSSYRE